MSSGIYNEKALLEQLAADSSEAFDTFYERYFEAVYRNVLKLTGDEHLTEDLVQEVFVSLWNKRKSFREEQQIAGWLFLTSYHKSIDQLRQYARRNILSRADTDQADDTTDIELAAMKESQFQLLEKAVATLPDRRRQAFEKCRLEGKSYKEAAEEMGISVNTLKEQLSKATESVRAYVLEHRGEMPVIVFLLLLAAIS